MSKIPPLTALRTEDYPAEERKWLPRLFLPLNGFLTAVTNCLNGRVEFGLNIPAITQNLSFIYDSMSQKILWPYTLSPQVLWVGQAYENGTAIAVVPVWSYDFSTRLVSVRFLKSGTDELTVGTSYKITIRIVP